MLKVLAVFGTRPEAIKMAPVIRELERYPETFQSLVCTTSQHRRILEQVLDLFAIRPHFDLNIMKPGQDLFDVTCMVLQGLKTVLSQAKPDIVLVHGDTATTMAASIACCYSRIRIGHVEAGLRTHHKYAPFPEEISRRVTGAVADLHFAPTPAARDNLLFEGIPAETIFVTGNTVIDALLSVSGRISTDAPLRNRLERKFAFLDPAKKLILVTCHRRESFGKGIEHVCAALAEIAAADSGVEIVYPVHPNPKVQEPVQRILGGVGHENIHLIGPLDYLAFIFLMNRAQLIITDSGGMQEEAPSLGKPVVVIRDVTERPEPVAAGIVLLAGTDREEVVAAGRRLLYEAEYCPNLSWQRNPYGDGRAAGRIADVLRMESQLLCRTPSAGLATSRPCDSNAAVAPPRMGLL